jgi:hypothetical protein
MITMSLKWGLCVFFFFAVEFLVWIDFVFKLKKLYTFTLHLQSSWKLSSFAILMASNWNKVYTAVCFHDAVIRVILMGFQLELM